MNISSASSVHVNPYRHMATQQASLVQQQNNQKSSSVDNDGDHDGGVPDGDKGRSVDIKA